MTTTREIRRERTGPTRIDLEICIGQAELAAGKLVYTRDGAREFSQFAYAEEWLTNGNFFDISPDLQAVLGYQLRKAPTRDDSHFFLALADTEPDAWGRRVIARDHAKRRKDDPTLGQLTELDYLCAVDDISRIGALRLRTTDKQYLRSPEDGKRGIPALVELRQAVDASRRLEMSQETAEDLKYLRGKATSLGGLRPKCSILDQDGALAIGKFPSVTDERSVVRGEVLALRLAALAGIDAAHARVEVIDGTPIAVIRRFDRGTQDARVPYISGNTVLQASRNHEHAYTEIVDVMRGKCVDFDADAKQLWRRMVFNHLITNVDDHLQNIGFLYTGRNMWRLSPAFDINPFPDKDRESKTWLSEDTGPVTSIGQLLGQAGRFQLTPDEARAVLAQVLRAVQSWREVAVSSGVAMEPKQIEEFAPAFEHPDLEEARRLADR